MIILETQNLKKYYGSKDHEVKALDGINLSIEQGSFAAIVGTSGSGKSTLLNMLGALDVPTSGNIIIDGRNIAELKKREQTVFRRRYTGFVFQNYHLLPVLNAYDNIVLPATFDSMRKIDHEYIQEIIQTLHIEKIIKRFPGEMSGGQQQRVAIARALANRPSLVLADEPTGNLDSKASLEVVCLLKESSERLHQTILMVTHNEELAQMCDFIIHIEDGKVINMEGKPL